MDKLGQKRTNSGSLPVNPILNVYAGMLADVIEERRVPLEARELLPKITNLTNVDITTREIFIPKYKYDGKALITDLKPKTVPVIAADTEVIRVPLKFISIGIEQDPNKKDDILNGKIYPINEVEKAMRVVAETENNFILNGFEQLGVKGFNDETIAGAHVVAAGKSWATSTGEEILEDILKLKKALTAQKKYEAKTLCIPHELDHLFDRTYTRKDGSEIVTGATLRQVLKDREYFENYKSILGIKNPVGMEDTPSTLGYVEVLPITLDKPYTEGRSEIIPVEEKVSGFVLMEPEALAILTGANDE